MERKMTEETKQLMEAAHRARAMYKTGQMSEKEAYETVGRYIAHVNEGAKRIAKEFGLTPRKATVAGFMR